MKKQLSSIDLHYLVKELENLKNSRIAKIYQPEKELLVFGLHKPNSGKKILKISIGESISIAEEKDEYPEILGFGQFLRKHIDGYFLIEIVQLKPERIIKFVLKAKEDTKHFYLEFIGKGNAVLCSGHDVILNALELHDFRDRSIRPKLKYVYPVMNYNLFDIRANALADLLKNSKKESLIVSLATELGLGGLYSEEVCLLSDIGKKISPKEADERQIHSIISSIKKIISNDADANVVLENGKVIDYAPFKLQFYSNKKYELKEFDTFSGALSYFYSQFKEIKEPAAEKKIKGLKWIIESQQQTITELRKEEHELRHKGEAVYHNYQLIKEVLDELNKASRKYSWKEIKDKLKYHKIIKEINEKDRKVVVEIG